jgi:hypothetical protein
MSLNFLRLLIINFTESTPSATLRPQQFIEFGLNSLGVSMLRALNEKSHAKSDQRNCAVKVQRVTIEDDPHNKVDDYEAENRGPGHPCTRFGQ